MTSGLVGDLSILGQQFVGAGGYRYWTGDDGRFEALPSGAQRSKWNNFITERGSRVRTSNQWTCVRAFDGVEFNVVADVQMAFPSWSFNKLELSAQSKLADKVRGHSFNLAVNAAQSKQLVDMVVGNLGKLGRSILALKRGDFSTAARQLGAAPRTSSLKPRDISGRWLELQYGWLPALSDTFEAAKAYEEITKKERKFTVRASSKEIFSGDDHVSGSFATCPSEMAVRVMYIHELTEELTAWRSLGLVDPLSVVWEIIPYSFVVDWFVPIGSYIDNLSVLPFLKGRTMRQSSHVIKGHGPLIYRDPLPGFFGGQLCSSVRYDGTDLISRLSATRSISIGVPPVAFPKFDSSGLHGRRIWNAIALASQRFLS